MKAEPHALNQPRLVQFAALLTDDLGAEISSISVIIRPDGFTIPDEAAAIHGITTELAMDRGVDCYVARNVYRRWWDAAKAVVGHNVDFDLFIMDGELFRYNGCPYVWAKPRDIFCTMQATTSICKIPSPYGYSDFKWPKLQEAYKHIFNCEFCGAHDALADVRACAKIYFWLKEQELNAPKL